MAGRQIRIFLVDGTPGGIRTAEIINWTGSILVVPRARLPEVATRREANRTGVYCLVGPDPDYGNRDKVYIGEGDNVFSRLAIHSKDATKDFWTTAVICVSKDENLTKAHGRYLESRLIAMAHAASRASIVNGTSPGGNPLPEADVSDMEYFLEQVQVVSNGEFVVLKGSTARKEGSPSWTSYKELRDELVQADKLRPSANTDYYEFAEDVPFRSPSAAATVVAAANRNGPAMWKVEGSSQSYGEWQIERLQAVDIETGGED